eukprot:CCRYP_013805-RF/>CCRYP_013805-RF protein AED:0.19 eAED:0.22 QI:0/0.8/0.83/1/0.6/0.33/6/2821/101
MTEEDEWEEREATELEGRAVRGGWGWEGGEMASLLRGSLERRDLALGSMSSSSTLRLIAMAVWELDIPSARTIPSSSPRALPSASSSIDQVGFDKGSTSFN